MWNAKDYFEEIQQAPSLKTLGYFFTCPACNEKLDMLFRTLPYTPEVRQEIIDKYKYDPQDNVWDKLGKLEDGTLSLHPSIVHMGCPNGGHYWVENGKIVNC